MMGVDLRTVESGTETDREEAAERLMALGEAVVPHVCEILSKGDSDARWWAARTLAGIQGAEATSALIDALLDPDEDVTVCAAMGLGERQERDPAVVTALLALLRRCSGYVGRHAADALSKIGESAVGGLVETLEDPRPSVRVQSARALARIGSQKSIPALITALDDPEAAVEYYAWDALQRLGVGVTVLFQP